MIHQKGGHHKGTHARVMADGVLCQDRWRVSQRLISRIVCYTMREGLRMDREQVCLWLLGGHCDSDMFKPILW